MSRCSPCCASTKVVPVMEAAAVIGRQVTRSAAVAAQADNPRIALGCERRTPRRGNFGYRPTRWA
jgi:hypothetical protein